MIIKQADFIQSIADSLQYISYYHSKEFINAMHHAYKKEKSGAAKNAIAQILINSRMCAEGHRPICQDTGIVIVFMKIGMHASWEAGMSIEEMVNEGVRQAYLNPDNLLRASMVSPPIGKRLNTHDNTPAVIHTEMVDDDKVRVIISAKGGGSENKSKFAILTPSDNVVDWVLKTVSNMGAGWCPPGILGIGIGGSAEKAMILAKESLMETVNIQNLIERGPATDTENLRLELYEKINQLGIGAQGLGGNTTVLDVKINTYPTHAASLPIAIIPNCAATRHTHFTLDGKGSAIFPHPKVSDWPKITWHVAHNTTKINLDDITPNVIRRWRSGQTLLLSGKLMTGRDAAHKRITECLIHGKSLPSGVDFRNRFIYYVGPVDAMRNEVVGPAGPTTAKRMDKFTEIMLKQSGLLGMIGKAERGKDTVNLIKKYKAVYLIAVGGAAYLISKSIRSAKVVGFADLGMEAIYEFEVDEMPVTVAIDTYGRSVHHIVTPILLSQHSKKI